MYDSGMKRTTVCRQAGRAIHDLMNRLVETRMARMPGVEETVIRREVWETLRQHANLDDPNRMDLDSSAAAVWVLSALLEMEPDQPRRGKAR